MRLEWQALSCCYRTSAGNKWVLKNIYGEACPGEMHVSLRVWCRSWPRFRPLVGEAV